MRCSEGEGRTRNPSHEIHLDLVLNFIVVFGAVSVAARTVLHAIQLRLVFRCQLASILCPVNKFGRLNSGLLALEGFCFSFCSFCNSLTALVVYSFRHGANMASLS